MNDIFINVNGDNITDEHLCCAIADKKHQKGVEMKKKWLMDRFLEGHVFRKLDAKGKVFIEYAPLNTAWVPVMGENYIYIYCLWVSGSYKGKGYGDALLKYCIDDAKSKGMDGICILSSKKKKPFLSEKKFMMKYGFKTVDTVDDYELLALPLNIKATLPHFADSVKNQCIEEKELTIFHDIQCPYIPNCLKQITAYCDMNHIPVSVITVDSLDKAKSMPCIFNNWAVFYQGRFETVHLLNEGYLKKMLDRHQD